MIPKQVENAAMQINKIRGEHTQDRGSTGDQSAELEDIVQGTDRNEVNTSQQPGPEEGAEEGEVEREDPEEEEYG